MPRVAPHHHACQDCGKKTECPGTWEENWDGEPAVICDEYHRPDGTIAEFICDDCDYKREHAEEANEAV